MSAPTGVSIDPDKGMGDQGHGSIKRGMVVGDSKAHNIIKNILITGNPGVGKTTLIRNIVSKLSVSAGGFYTAEVRDGSGRRWGFRIITLGGREDVLASVDTISDHRVGKYGVNVEAMDRVAVPAIRDALSHCDIVVMDEIGRMELTSKEFRDVITQAFDSSKPVLGTIALKKSTNFARKAVERADTRIIKLTRANFTEVEMHVARLLKKVGIE